MKYLVFDIALFLILNQNHTLSGPALTSVYYPFVPDRSTAHIARGQNYQYDYFEK